MNVFEFPRGLPDVGVACGVVVRPETSVAVSVSGGPASSSVSPQCSPGAESTHVTLQSWTRTVRGWSPRSGRGSGRGRGPPPPGRTRASTAWSTGTTPWSWSVSLDSKVAYKDSRQKAGWDGGNHNRSLVLEMLRMIEQFGLDVSQYKIRSDLYP